MAQVFGTFVEQWLDDQRVRLRPSTLQGYGVAITQYLLPAFGDVALDAITTRQITALYAALLRDGGTRGWPLSPASVRRCHAVLSRVLDAAVMQGIVDRNAAWGAAVPRHDFSRFEPKVWNASEVGRFLQLIDGHPLANLFHLAAATGMRRGELLGLTPEDVTGNHVTVRWTVSEIQGHMRRLHPKARRPRVLTIDDETSLRLQRQRLCELTKPQRDLPWQPLFTDTNGSLLRPDAVSHAFRTIVKHSDLPRIRLHDLRHTHATLLLAHGIPMHVVGARLGHAPQTTLLYYAHVLPPSDALAAAHYGGLITGAESGNRHPEAGTWTEANSALYTGMWAWKKKMAYRNSTARSRRNVVEQ